MRIHLRGLAAILILGASVSGCAAGMGTAAGDVVGGTAWAAVHGGKLAWKGGTFAAKTTGKVVVGAAKGVHEEFSGPSNPSSKAQTASGGQSSTTTPPA